MVSNKIWRYGGGSVEDKVPKGDEIVALLIMLDQPLLG